MSNDIKRRGLMLVLSSPSGAGKTTLAKRLLEDDKNISGSISATTRPRRDNEEYGVDYFFLSHQEFAQWERARRFLEHATVFGNSYGTPIEHVRRTLENGRDMLFDIDWQGTQQIKRKMRKDVISIFILPPSHAELERRLRNRALDTHDVVADRMAKAADEMKHYDEYDYVVVNREVEPALAQIKAILEAERVRRTRLIGVDEFVAELTKQ
jgi:guanylate kinase